MFGVDLGKPEDFRIGELASQVVLHLVQVVYLLFGEGQAFLLVVLVYVVYIDDRFRFPVGGKHVAVQFRIHPLQHRVVFCVFACHREILLDPRYALQPHALGNLDGIRTPRSNHFLSRTDKRSFYLLRLVRFGIAEQPAQFFHIFIAESLFSLHSYDTL